MILQIIINESKRNVRDKSAFESGKLLEEIQKMFKINKKCMPK